MFLCVFQERAGFSEVEGPVSARENPPSLTVHCLCEDDAVDCGEPNGKALISVSAVCATPRRGWMIVRCSKFAERKFQWRCSTAISIFKIPMLHVCGLFVSSLKKKKELLPP